MTSEDALEDLPTVSLRARHWREVRVGNGCLWPVTEKSRRSGLEG